MLSGMPLEGGTMSNVMKEGKSDLVGSRGVVDIVLSDVRV